MRAVSRVGLILVVLAVAGCSSPTGEGSFDLSEWAIAGPAQLSEDVDSIGVINSGSVPHTLVVTNSSGQVVAVTDLIRPGGATDLTLDLEQGNVYSFTCRIVAQNPEGEIVDHYEAGMNTVVSVTG